MLKQNCIQALAYVHVLFKVNKRTQELALSDPHQAPNTKRKDRQNNKATTKRTDGKQSWQLFPENVETILPELK